MASVDSAAGSEPGRSGNFLTTHWSVVLAAGADGSASGDQALATLCQAYWFPLYAFTRRQGYSPDNAQDLTQGFFAQLLEKKYLGRADPKRGRFRSFLLASLKHYLNNEFDKQQTAKRGGGPAHISFDQIDAENRYLGDTGAPLTPDLLFDRQWALTVIDRVLPKVQAELDAAGKAAAFDHLKGCLTGDSAARPYAEIAAELNSSEGAVKVLVHRMRQRFRELIREEIAETLVDPAQVDEEMRHLLAALSP